MNGIWANENFWWGIGIILGGFGLLLNALFDGNPSTSPDWNLFFTTVMLGIGKMRSAPARVTAIVKDVRDDVKVIKSDLRMSGQ